LVFLAGSLSPGAPQRQEALHQKPGNSRVADWPHEMHELRQKTCPKQMPYWQFCDDRPT
jgi:hypothetical protein